MLKSYNTVCVCVCVCVYVKLKNLVVERKRHADAKQGRPLIKLKHFKSLTNAQLNQKACIAQSFFFKIYFVLFYFIIFFVLTVCTRRLPSKMWRRARAALRWV